MAPSARAVSSASARAESSGGNVNAGGFVGMGGLVGVGADGFSRIYGVEGVAGMGGLVGVGADGFSRIYGVEGVSPIYLLLCEGGGIIGVPGALLLFQVAGEAGSSGSTFRSPTWQSVAADFFFLSHSFCAVGR
ncbi:hypothetical protein U9M48_033529 [Paspalum notatum var. saurae]|uniref:Uncharacterized protein n=1 Tax=Paspalum notatum var. saurae TaxID=547442 RepID=A0AAQ3X6R4_PASNO